MTRAAVSSARHLGMYRAMGSAQRCHVACERGATLVEVLLALASSVTVGALAIASVSDIVDHIRTSSAARYMAGRVGAARMDSVRRATAVALRFEPAGDDYQYAPVEDGNGNGVRTVEIRSGIDPVLGNAERLADRFPGVRFELAPGVPDVDGDGDTGTGGVRVGSAGILTFSSEGTASSGTLYIRGRRRQYAVRVLGVTGRARMLEYNAGNRTWLSR